MSTEKCIIHITKLEYNGLVEVLKSNAALMGR
ncbi:hypothetical protein VIAQ111709_07095 [Vibrio aquimaris]|uniref:Uncharacterized protein n=1 Tax=Vibrio aquimaris TaxID=2587862 RepID=A0A5P9CL66_9VIBR|nr:hypothetical protein FIV01_07610 [Vibrio aquimaris]